MKTPMRNVASIEGSNHLNEGQVADWLNLSKRTLQAGG